MREKMRLEQMDFFFVCVSAHLEPNAFYELLIFEQFSATIIVINIHTDFIDGEIANWCTLLESINIHSLSICFQSFIKVTTLDSMKIYYGFKAVKSLETNINS